jgi:hypothetical protein
MLEVMIPHRNSRTRNAVRSGLSRGAQSKNNQGQINQAFATGACVKTAR